MHFSALAPSWHFLGGLLRGHGFGAGYFRRFVDVLIIYRFFPGRHVATGFFGRVLRLVAECESFVLFSYFRRIAREFRVDDTASDHDVWAKDPPDSGSAARRIGIDTGEPRLLGQPSILFLSQLMEDAGVLFAAEALAFLVLAVSLLHHVMLSVAAQNRTRDSLLIRQSRRFYVRHREA